MSRADITDRLERENAETLADMAERRERRLYGEEPRMWQVPEPEPVPPPVPAPQPVRRQAVPFDALKKEMRAEFTMTLHEVVEVIGDEVGKRDWQTRKTIKSIRSELTRLSAAMNNSQHEISHLKANLKATLA